MLLRRTPRAGCAPLTRCIAAQWFFQRYTPHLPSAGEMVLFDRSWYNRAGVEHVMGFCTPEQYERFMLEVPAYEDALVASGTILIKVRPSGAGFGFACVLRNSAPACKRSRAPYAAPPQFWLEVSDAEQERRFQDRLRRSWKRWKLSPMDLFARSRWTEYARARDAMLQRTDTPAAPWWVLESDNKQLAHLNCINHILATVPYEDVALPPLALPPRESDEGYTQPPRSAWRFVPAVYTAKKLEVGGSQMLQAATLEVAQLVEEKGILPGPEK